jgi:hypothetical protein
VAAYASGNAASAHETAHSLANRDRGRPGLSVSRNSRVSHQRGEAREARHRKPFPQKARASLSVPLKAVLGVER